MSGTEPPRSVTVVVPTFRRPGPLERCLTALVAQDRPADQVVVVAHMSDLEGARVVDRFAADLPLELASAADRRQVVAMEAGVRAATGDVVAMTDDDAEPRPDWLARLLPHYDSVAVGGVGGRDATPGTGAAAVGPAPRVGVLQPFGRVIGNHHLGSGPPRDVDVLKGVNMSMRRGLWRLDPALRGEGNQMHWELDVCLRARREGWRLVYDPAIVVDHTRAPRVAEAQRDELGSRALTDIVHNELYAVVKWTPPARRALAVAYAFAVGQRNAPGPLLLPERLAREGDAREVLRRARAGARGRVLAVRGARAYRRAHRAAR